MNTHQAKTVTTAILHQHGLIAQGWSFEVGRGKRRLGACSYRFKRIRISLDHIQLGTDDEVINTIRHEVAHALAGPRAKHGPLWKQWAIKLGANPASMSTVERSTPRQWELVCGLCSVVVQRRHNRVSDRRLTVMYHRRCGKPSAGKLFIRPTTLQSIGE